MNRLWLRWVWPFSILWALWQTSQFTHHWRSVDGFNPPLYGLPVLGPAQTISLFNGDTPKKKTDHNQEAAAHVNKLTEAMR